MKPLSFNQLAKLTAGASGGLVITNAATSVSVMATSGPESTFGRVMRVGVPALATTGIVMGLPRNEYTQGAAIGAALVAVSQVMSMGVMMLSSGETGSGDGSSGQSGMGAATRTAAMGGGVPASRALSRANGSGASGSRANGMGINRSTELMAEEGRASTLERD
jgi:hypothetical protein